VVWQHHGFEFPRSENADTSVIPANAICHKYNDGTISYIDDTHDRCIHTKHAPNCLEKFAPALVSQDDVQRTTDRMLKSFLGNCVQKLTAPHAGSIDGPLDRIES
jgi:hypothetical protein